MKEPHGLVFGKFYPFHNGHKKLIEYAKQNSQKVSVLVCAEEKEVISGQTRKNWIEETIADVNVVVFNYNDSQLSSSSVPSEEVSSAWANIFLSLFSDVTAIFTSENYGEYVSRYMNVNNYLYDKNRIITPICGTDIRTDVFANWDYLPLAVKKFFTLKFVIAGTESTGKTTLTKCLGEVFESPIVSEVGRDIIPVTEECKPEHLEQIAVEHAKAIESALCIGSKTIFIDTDVYITKSYSEFLFGNVLQVNSNILALNKATEVLFLHNHVPYIQDGTRLSEEKRNKLHLSHLRQYEINNISPIHLKNNTFLENKLEAISIIYDKLKTFSILRIR